MCLCVAVCLPLFRWWPVAPWMSYIRWCMCICVAVCPPVQVVACGSLDELHQVVYVCLCSGLSPPVQVVVCGSLDELHQVVFRWWPVAPWMSYIRWCMCICVAVCLPLFRWWLVAPWMSYIRWCMYVCIGVSPCSGGGMWLPG